MRAVLGDPVSAMDGKGRVPYFMSANQKTRDAFRKARGTLQIRDTTTASGEDFSPASRAKAAGERRQMLTCLSMMSCNLSWLGILSLCSDSGSATFSLRRLDGGCFGSFSIAIA